MEMEKLESLLVDFIDGKLSVSDQTIVNRELEANPDANALYQQLKVVMHAMDQSQDLEPTGKLKSEFDQFLMEESAKPVRDLTIFSRSTWYRIAASVVLVVLGGSIGFWISRQQDHEAEMMAMRKEVNATKQILMTMLENQQSASQRVMGATVAFNDIVKADDEIANALIHAMNTDENTNVRIAALEALGKFHNQPHVRAALIISLKTQKDPLVQIALIRLMTEIKEKSIIQELQRISTDEEALPAVKDEAHAGIVKLS